MHLKYLVYLLFCALCCVVSHPSDGPQDGLSGWEQHTPPSPPDDDHQPAQAYDTRPIPQHSFEKRVLKKNSADKKVFVSFVQGPYTFKKRKEKAGRVIFSCNTCQKFGHYLPVCAMRDIVDSDPENDVYTLDFDTLPSAGEHRCGNSGVELQVKQFRQDLEAEVIYRQVFTESYLAEQFPILRNSSTK